MRRAVVAFSIRNRRRKANAIGRFMDEQGVRTVVVVGGSGSGLERNEAIIEREIQTRADTFTFDFEIPAGPPWPDARGDGRAIPVRAGAVDMVLSNAVIEHVGDENDQARLMAEHLRVGRCWVVTTPNRWFPIESHTSTVFRHWSPAWRAQRNEFTRLLSLREFRALLPPDARVSGRWWSPTFLALGTVRVPESAVARR